MRNALIIVGALLVLAGGFSLAGGSFSWTDEETVVDMGPVQATAETRENAALPPLVAGGMVVLGVGLGVFGVTRKS